MPRIYMTFKLGKFDKDKYTQALLKVLEGRMRLAASEFVRAALSRVPVETGMAAGSFLNVGRYIRTQLLQRAKTIGPKATTEAAALADALIINPQPYRLRKRKVTLKNGRIRTYEYREHVKWYYHINGRRMPKTPESGAALSTPPSKVFGQNGLNLKFTFNSRVYHFNLNEFFKSRSPTSPWLALERGRAAFLTSMQNSLSDLPKLQQFVGNTSITVGPGSGIVIRENAPPTSSKYGVELNG